MTVIGDAFVAIHPESAGFVGSLQKQLAGVNLAGTGSLIGASLAAGLVVGLAKIGQQFGSARVQITRETGAIGKDLDDTFNTVKDVLKSVPDSIGTVTTAVDELRRRGTPLGAAFNVLAKQELELARITKSDLGATVEETTALFTKFNVPLRDQPKALDAIFKGYQASGKGLSDLTGSLRAGGAALQQFGFDIFSSTALISGLERAGVNVQPALAGLRKAFATIAKEGGDPKKALQNLITEFTDGTPKTQAMADAIKLFGSRSGTELATAIEAGKFNVKDLLKTITDGKGGIDATAAASRTFGEELAILKNNALVAIQPFATQVWQTIRSAILLGVQPAEDFATAIADVAKELAPVGVAIGALVAGGFVVLLDIVKLTATGLEGVATILSHIPAPVLIAAGAVAILAKAFFSLRALGALSSVGDAVAGLSLGLGAISNPITQVILGLTALGVIISLFKGHANAATAEAKDLSAALFETAGSGRLFADGIGSAARGLLDFLNKQDQAGKIKNLDDALKGTTVTLQTVATATAGNADQFESLKSSLADQLNIPETARAFAKLTVEQQSALVSAGKVSGTTIDQANAFSRMSDALDQQRDAFIKSAEAQLNLSARSGDLTAAQRAQADVIAHATTGVRGYGAALDFANEAITENQRKTEAAKIASDAFAPSLSQLKSLIIDGTIGTNDAADASAKFGLELETTKGIISDTQAALKSFVSEGLAGLPTSSDAVTSWGKNIETTFQAVADSAGKPAKEVAKAKAELLRALDPAQVVAQVQAQAVQIAKFQTNIETLVAKFPNAVRALLANPDKTAAAQFAQALVDKPAIAAQFDAAQATIQSKTAAMSALLSGPLAQQFLAGGQAIGTAASTGVAEKLDLKTPVTTAVSQATSALSVKEQFQSAAGDTAGAANTAFQRRFLLANTSRTETGAAATAITQAAKPVAAAAGSAGTDAATAFGGGLDVKGKTTAAVAGSQSVWQGQVTIDTANFAGFGGTQVGIAFGKGIETGISNSTFGITIAAQTAVSKAVTAAKAAAGIRSPSSVGIEIGKNFVDAIGTGLSDTTLLRSQASSAGASIAASFGGLSVPVAVTPIVGSLTVPNGVVHLTPLLEPITVPPLVLPPAPVEVLPHLAQLVLPASELEVRPIVDPIALSAVSVAVTPLVAPIALPPAVLHVAATVAPVELSAVRLAVAPVIAPIELPTALLDVVPHLEKLAVPAATVDVTAKLAPLAVPPGTVELAAHVASVTVPATTVHAVVAPLAPQPVALVPHVLAVPKLAAVSVPLVPKIDASSLGVAAVATSQLGSVTSAFVSGAVAQLGTVQSAITEFGTNIKQATTLVVSTAKAAAKEAASVSRVDLTKGVSLQHGIDALAAFRKGQRDVDETSKVLLFDTVRLNDAIAHGAPTATIVADLKATAAAQTAARNASRELAAATGDVQRSFSVKAGSAQYISDLKTVSREQKAAADVALQLKGALAQLSIDMSHGAPTSVIAHDLTVVAGLQTRSRDTSARLSDALKAVQHDIATGANTAKFVEDMSKVREASAAAAKAQADLVKAQQVRTFIDNLNQQTNAGRAFEKSLGALVGQFPLLAAELAKAGPEAGGALASAFAGDRSSAKAAEAAIKAGQAFTGTYGKWLADHFPALAAQTSDVTGQAVQNVQALADIAKQLDDALSASAKTSVHITGFDDPASIRKAAGELDGIVKQQLEIAKGVAPAAIPVPKLPVVPPVKLAAHLDSLPKLPPLSTTVTVAQPPPVKVQALLDKLAKVPDQTVHVTAVFGRLAQLAPITVSVSPVLSSVPALADLTVHVAPLVDALPAFAAATVRVVPEVASLPAFASVTVDVVPVITKLPAFDDLTVQLVPVVGSIGALHTIIDVTPIVAALPPFPPMTVEVTPIVAPVLVPNAVPVPSVSTVAASTALQSASTAATGTQTLELALTVVLEDGRVVQVAPFTAIVPKLGALDRKVEARLKAIGT